MIRCIRLQSSPIDMGTLPKRPEPGDLVRSMLYVFKVLGTLQETDEVVLFEMGTASSLPSDMIDDLPLLERRLGYTMSVR